MKIFCCQLDIRWEDKPANYARARILIEAARPAPGSLVLLPEMFATGFSMNVAQIHERSPSETEVFLSALANDLEIFVVGGLVTLDKSGRGRNEAVVFAPGNELVTRYCKHHPFTLGGESQHYVAGDELVSFKWAGCTVAPFICYDLRFPEIFRTATRRGAEMFAVIADWPAKRDQHWITLLKARAIENQAYVAGANRCGTDPFHVYSGRSIIVDPHGEIIADARDEETVISAEIDVEGLRAWRKNFPALADMRPEYVR